MPFGRRGEAGSSAPALAPAAAAESSGSPGGWFALDAVELVPRLAAWLLPGDVVLFKGSRGARVELERVREAPAVEQHELGAQRARVAGLGAQRVAREALQAQQPEEQREERDRYSRY
jgi:hypothetical protein